jgi:hypothetical protein
MAKTMFGDVPLHLRPSILADNCVRQDHTTYLKELTPEELDIKRESLHTSLSKMFRLQEEAKKIAAEFKEQIKPLGEECHLLCEQVDTGKEEVTGTLFEFPDFEASVMNVVDEKGEFVSSRRLTPKEKQARLFVADGARVGNGE